MPARRARGLNQRFPMEPLVQFLCAAAENPVILPRTRIESAVPLLLFFA